MNSAKQTILITGGAGFIGSALIRYLIENSELMVINFDALTYAGNLESLKSVSTHNRYHFVQGNICSSAEVRDVLSRFRPQYVMHLAAESHVDRSIDGPAEFIQTNIVGTYNLLEQVRHYWCELNSNDKSTFRFHHISTDEVFGSLEEEGLFTEDSQYKPSSPYSASKASSDHLVRAWHATYNIPILITNCSNNYGPYQYPEKLIPLTILNALSGQTLPVYGDGAQIRDWLYVVDHVKALYTVLISGVVGETYNIGGNNEYRNIQVVEMICEVLEELAPSNKNGIDRYCDLIRFVEDRPGHDQRYAIDSSKIQRELGWKPEETFESGLRETVLWYLDSDEWCTSARKKHDGSRMGVVVK